MTILGGAPELIIGRAAMISIPSVFFYEMIKQEEFLQLIRDNKFLFLTAIGVLSLASLIPIAMGAKYEDFGACFCILSLFLTLSCRIHDDACRIDQRPCGNDRYHRYPGFGGEVGHKFLLNTGFGIAGWDTSVSALYGARRVIGFFLSP